MLEQFNSWPHRGNNKKFHNKFFGIRETEVKRSRPISLGHVSILLKRPYYIIRMKKVEKLLQNL